MRESAIYRNINTQYFKAKLLSWAQNFSHIAYYDSNYSDNNFNKKSYQNYDCIVGVDKISELIIGENDNFEKLKSYSNKVKDWIFGFLTYDLKNEIEDLKSKNSDNLNMPIMSFFQPKLLFFINKNIIKVEFDTDYTPRILVNNLVKQIKCYVPNKINSTEVNLIQKVSKEKYIENINEIKKYINKGYIYEMNYCIEFYSEETLINPVEKYLELNKLSSSPFSCFYKLYDRFLMSASPERFLMKKGVNIISQPIKGTAKRGITPEEDLKFKTQLANDSKEQSENVMIVDLVRNDLSKTAETGSVEVEELFGIYTFPQLHQMISTVKSKLRNDVNFFDAIKDCFPMGSMTGAPKIKSMELIEKFEETKRGLYSGAVGYVSPYYNFDFNVVIRSIQYNKSRKYVSFMVGSAITSKSDPEKEYAECLLKAAAMKQALYSNS